MKNMNDSAELSIVEKEYIQKLLSEGRISEADLSRVQHLIKLLKNKLFSAAL